MKGLAAASTNVHILFDEDEEETESETRHRDEDDEDNSSSRRSSNKVTRELRDAFLQQMRSKMESVQQDDKVNPTERSHSLYDNAKAYS